MPEIFAATSQHDFECAAELFKEYATWLGINLGFQKFDAELADVSTAYAAPAGCILLAKENNVVAGCVALRPLAPGVAELKRMYVQKPYRQIGLAAALYKSCEQYAINQGYRSIKLDTLSSMIPAMKFYQKAGFVQTEPYYFNPNSNTVYFEKTL